MTPLTANFTLEDFTRSQTATRFGIRNVPNAAAVASLTLLSAKVLEPTYKKFGKALIITSGFRSLALNTQIGRKSTSQHVKGQAADIEVPGVPNIELAEWIVANLDFDQCILEFYSSRDPAAGWVHVSYVSPEKNRRATLTASLDAKGKTVYTVGFPKRRKAA